MKDSYSARYDKEANCFYVYRNGEYFCNFARSEMHVTGPFFGLSVAQLERLRMMIIYEDGKLSCNNCSNKQFCDTNDLAPSDWRIENGRFPFDCHCRYTGDHNGSAGIRKICPFCATPRPLFDYFVHHNNGVFRVFRCSKCELEFEEIVK